VETPLSSKTKTLAQMWVNFREDSDFSDFIKFNDISLPLAYFYETGMVPEISERGIEFINQTWDLLISALELPTDIEWNDFNHMLEYIDTLDK
jgi:RNAse (barnase) inhibitor barstar